MGVRRVFVIGCLAAGLVAPAGPLAGAADAPAWIVPVQVPYEGPPKTEDAPNTAVPPLTGPMTPEQVKRAEALLPMLEGKQELWAMGEFVHLGPPVVPVLVGALKMPGVRLRYNAIETLSMIKDPGAVPALIETAKTAEEAPKVREHALRVAVKLDAAKTVPAIEAMAKDPNPTIRKAAAFEARHVRSKAVIPFLIQLVPDDEKFVAISAVQSLWLLTRHPTDMHDWENSSKPERQEWAQEWSDWWKESGETFELPEPRRPRPPL